MTRQQMISSLEKKGYLYYWKRFKTSQIYCMYQRYVLKR